VARSPLGHRPALAALAICLVLPELAQASEPGGHGDPSAAVVLGLAIILVAAKLGGEIAVRLGQAAVLGELVAGVALGNVDLLGIGFFEPLGTNVGIDLAARIGVLVLLFQVGLESTVKQMLEVGWTALLVAVLGVVTPFALGWAAAAWLLPNEGVYCHVFIGATLTATSVGITARVLKDLGRSDSAEARIILGAAVIDDVLGLVILAVVTGLIAGAARGQSSSVVDTVWIFVKSFGFLAVALAVGTLGSRRVFRIASRLRADGVLLALSLAFCFALAWAADAIGLASIVGAFAAGLVLERVHYAEFTARGEHTIDELLHPIASFLVPVFFVVMGLRTDLRAFADLSNLGVAAVLTAVAIAGKLVCGLGVSSELDRVAVGFGMIPRGEVGLIFANIGLSLSVGGHPVVGKSVFAAIVVLVIVTTMATPPLLKWRLGRARVVVPERA
jgi:Kef-type K+ transport system membrane component KefB